ncbi:hypothetical protein D9M70_481020 [compost metagenome]
MELIAKTWRENCPLVIRSKRDMTAAVQYPALDAPPALAMKTMGIGVLASEGNWPRQAVKACLRVGRARIAVCCAVASVSECRTS